MTQFKKILTVIIFMMTSIQVNAKSMNKPATDFLLPSLTAAQKVSLKQFAGKVVYLDFWASWCKPCVKSFPVLEQLHKKYEQQGLVVIAVNLDEKQQNAKDFLKKYPVTYNVLWDQSASTAQTYEVQSMPSAYFIDKKGTIRLSHRGFKESDAPKIEKVIQVLLAE